MTLADKIKRAIAFYTAVTLFCILLPVMLSYALGYKIDFANLRIYKTGIIYLNSTPAGASIYINGKLHNDLTPARIEELKPDTYKVEVRREGFYSWKSSLTVHPNMVTRVDRIVLFPITQDIKRLTKYQLSDFVISDKNQIYQMTARGLFRSNADGSSLKNISDYSNWPKKPFRKKFSPDGNKILCFTDRDIFVIYLNLDKGPNGSSDEARVSSMLVLEYPIIDVFWYSDSGYMIIVTDKYISAMELRWDETRNNVVPLYEFESNPRDIYYDSSNDSLYFTDRKIEEGLKDASHLYRIDLRKSFFRNLIGLLLKKEEEEMNVAR